nr:hypothetical protein [uncultured Methanospirillum sp.]
MPNNALPSGGRDTWVLIILWNSDDRTGITLGVSFQCSINLVCILRVTPWDARTGLPDQN